MPIFYDKNEILEMNVIALWDMGDSTYDISYLIGVTHNKVLRVLERGARIVPKKCLHCNELLARHKRCPYCEILLHTISELLNNDCGSCRDTYGKNSKSTNVLKRIDT